MFRKALVRAVAPLVALSVLALGGVGWVGSERALHPHYYQYKWSLSSFPDLQPEKIEIHSSTGVTLSGRFFPASRRALIILVSGYGDTQDQMLPFADFLHRAGFSTMTFNMRARATSGGEYVTLGVLEQKDLISVVNYAISRRDVDPERIGVLGISMGGATVILAAAQDPVIRAVVDDCGFSDAPRVVAASFEHFIHLPAFPFAPITVWIASQRAGIDINAVRPMDVIGRISPRPVFIVHGLADRVVPPDNSRRNFDAARQPKELWLVPDAAHGQAHTVAKAEYERRVIAFFNSALN